MQQNRGSRFLVTMIVTLFLVVCLLVTVVGGGLYLWARQDEHCVSNPLKVIQLKIRLSRYSDQLDQSAAERGFAPTDRDFIINPGDTAQVIAANLRDQGLIVEADLFVDYVQYHCMDAKLAAGTYALDNAQTLKEIARTLTDSRITTVELLTIEGWRLEEIAQKIGSVSGLRIAREEFLAVVQSGASIPDDFKAWAGIPDLMYNGNPPSLEGFLFPATYDFTPGITALALRDEMLNTFRYYVTPEYDAYVARTLPEERLSLYEIVTLASIVEREAVDPDESPLIASVYLNRLNLPMRLGADPTVQYAIGNTRDGTWWPQITQADYWGQNGVQPNSSYNTYLKQDTDENLLPPGPIAAPGLAAIKGVLNPAPTQYYYMISCPGETTHTFFKLDEQQLHATHCGG